MATLFVDNLTVLDFSYLHAKRGMVGESWMVDLELSGELDEQGMVFDFGDIKHAIKKRLDDTADHRLLVPADHDQLSLREEDQRIQFMLLQKGKAGQLPVIYHRGSFILNNFLLF